MAVKTYGHIGIDTDGIIVIDRAEPHICIRLKQIFPKIGKTSVLPFMFKNTPENSNDLIWFMDRYPLDISAKDLKVLAKGRTTFINNVNELESIFSPDYVPHEVQLKEGKAGRHYQLIGRDYYYKVKRMLLGDDLGLGKTITAILSLANKEMLPGIVIVPSHLTSHWKEKIEEFTNLTIHIVKTGKPYNLPPADVYISKYNFLYKWIDVFKAGTFKQAILDEVQDLRHQGTNKYDGAKVLSANVEMIMAMSATPIFNYGNEIFNITKIINEGCLGTWEEFSREWMADDKKVNNPKALGTYLREKNIMLRRTRREVGKELPPINKLVYTVEYDQEAVDNAEQQAIQLAIRTTTGSFMERGQAAFELDVFLRKLTGVSKAKYVAEFVKIMLETGEPIVLAGWHRDVYDIWAKELKEYNPVFYTGTESPRQKDESKRKFLDGETNLFIISLRSGSGLDGLQFRCNTVVYGELDYSPKVHDQLTARVDRDRGEGGEDVQTTAIYLVSDGGSDPVIIDMLGLKASQADGVMDPDSEIFDQVADESRIKQMAQRYLQKRNIKVETAV
jgi:SNF2 family DNA or RNA helicase